MKVLTVYHTMTGNTEKIAKAIHQELSKRHESYLKKVDEVDQQRLNRHEVVFVGSPCHGGDLSAPVKKFLNNLPESPKFKLALFLTHSSPDRSEFENCYTSAQVFAKEKNILLLGYYDCQGRLAPEIQPYVKEARKLSDDEWTKMMDSIEQRPNVEDVEKAMQFAREMLSRAQRKKGPGKISGA
jgi:flavodoxin